MTYILLAVSFTLSVCMAIAAYVTTQRLRAVERAVRQREVATRTLHADLKRLLSSENWTLPTLGEIVVRRVASARAALDEQLVKNSAQLARVEAGLESETAMKERKRLYDDKHRVLGSIKTAQAQGAALDELEAEFRATMAYCADRRLSSEVVRLTDLLLDVHLSFRGSAAEAALDRENDHRTREEEKLRDKLWELRKRPRYPGEDAIALDPPNERTPGTS